MLPLIVWAIDTVATGFRATATEKKIDMTTHTNECYYVRSTTASDYFVPTKTAAEWTAFAWAHGSVMEKWKCGIPENSCRIWYDYRIDGNDAPIRYTAFTNNTTTYQTWSWSLDERNDDEHCNGWCWVRASVQCTNNDYAIRVWYQYDAEDNQSGVFYTPWSDVSTSFWSWALVTVNDQTECNKWCGVRMFIETRWDDALVNCSIWYRHRSDDSSNISPWAYDGAWSTMTYNTGDDEDCENWDCGMQARIYCNGPGGGNSSTSSSSTSSTSWWATGQCGPADGWTYSGPPPGSTLCSVGTIIWPEDLWNTWVWECSAANGNDYCSSTDSTPSWSTSSTSGNPLN